MKRRGLLCLLLFVLISMSSLPAVGASKARRAVRVLYLGNDYYQDDGDDWIDANRFIIEALEGSRSTVFDVVHILPSEEDGFRSIDLDLDEFDVVIFSEVWRSHFAREQLLALRKFVKEGGGFIMFGGWGGYGGHESYGEWDKTVVEDISPVKILSNEDAVDLEFRILPKSRRHLKHPIMKGLDWKTAPPLLGYNQVKAKRRAEVLAVNSENGDPIIIVRRYGRGRVVAFTSNPAGGWGMGFVGWTSYDRFIRNMVGWSASQRRTH